MKDLYNVNFKIVKKETEEFTRRWRDLPCSWISRISIIEMAILSKVVYRFNASPNKIPMTFYTELKKKKSKVNMETSNTTISQYLASNLTTEP